MTVVCRLCAQTIESGVSFNLLQSSLLMSKIQKYLPHMHMDFQFLQPYICLDCKSKVELWDSFYRKCGEAQKRLVAKVYYSEKSSVQLDTQNVKKQSHASPTKKKQKSAYCCAKFCSNSIVNEKLFALPTNVERAKEWLELANRSDLLVDFDPTAIKKKRLKLCRQHFEPDMFMNEARMKLNCLAKPTIFKSIEKIKGSADVSESAKYRKIVPRLEEFDKSLQQNSNSLENELRILKADANNDSSSSSFVLVNSSEISATSSLNVLSADSTTHEIVYFMIDVESNNDFKSDTPVNTNYSKFIDDNLQKSMVKVNEYFDGDASVGDADVRVVPSNCKLVDVEKSIANVNDLIDVDASVPDVDVRIVPTNTNENLVDVDKAVIEDVDACTGIEVSCVDTFSAREYDVTMNSLDEFGTYDMHGLSKKSTESSNTLDEIGIFHVAQSQCESLDIPMSSIDKTSCDMSAEYFIVSPEEHDCGRVSSPFSSKMGSNIFQESNSVLSLASLSSELSWPDLNPY